MSRAVDQHGDARSLIEASRERLASTLGRREAVAGALFAGGFLAAAIALAVVAPGAREVSPAVLAVLLAAFVSASRVEFEVGSGCAVPTQLAFVPLLFALPVGLVPLAVAGVALVGALPEVVRGRTPAARVLLPLSSCWYALGPTLVLTIAGEPSAASASAPVLLLALASQVGGDALATLLRERLAHGVRSRELAGPLAWVALIDALLAPVGLAVAVAIAARPEAVLAAPALVALLAVFSAQWRARIDQALELREERDARLRLERLAREDALTGLANRRAWDEALELALERATRADRADVCVAVLDLDHFKAYNDAHGHPAGDALLRAVGERWRAELRGVDLLARYGGEEFVALLPGCPLHEARPVLERLRRVMPAGSTASVGLAQWDGRETSDGLMRRADEALYRAKRAGRDTVMSDPPSTLHLVLAEVVSR
jgi:diguanylate cyclase (GGDEF)-like protein